MNRSEGPQVYITLRKVPLQDAVLRRAKEEERLQSDRTCKEHRRRERARSKGIDQLKQIIDIEPFEVLVRVTKTSGLFEGCSGR